MLRKPVKHISELGPCHCPADRCMAPTIMGRRAYCWRDDSRPDPASAEKNERNARVQARYDELMREGKHGHYETLFRVVHEEIERVTPNVDIDGT